MISEHTGKDEGFSRYSCDRCDNGLAGDRWIWFQLNDKNYEEMGECCSDCLEEINN
tara:strand:+ start:690 stop:857 length:168 start_codon:yes stop_codon:yes gene_type:complete